MNFLKKLVCLFALMVMLIAFSLSAAASGSLSLNVDYGNIVCGEETAFTLSASGGSGNYRYMLNSVFLLESGGYELVTDPSRMPGYAESNTIGFTFCASGDYMLYFYVMDMTTHAYTRQIIKCTIADSRFPSSEQKAASLARECLAAGCTSDYEKALWVHDRILDICTYDYSMEYCGAEGALCRGKGTCESYHRAYVMVLQQLGIPTGRMEGNGHVWTAVKLDGNWYQTDVTWDDVEYTSSSWEKHLYFCLNDEIMALVHSDHTAKQGYESGTLADNYLIRSGEITTWAVPYVSLVQNALDGGKTSFRLAVSSSWPEGYNNVLYSVSAWYLEHLSWKQGTNPVSLRISYDEESFIVSVSPSSGPSGNTDAESFTDVVPGSWYYDAVYWALKEQITSGTDSCHFSPKKTLTVAQLVQFLYNAAGQPEEYRTEGPWYASARAWAEEKGFIEESAEMAEPCSRLQTVKMMYAAEGSPEVDGPSPFSDSEDDAVIWAYVNGITSGNGKDAFLPDTILSRAQAVQFIYNYLRNGISLDG